VIQRGRNLLDAWENIMESARQGAAKRVYSQFDGGAKGEALLCMPLEQIGADLGSDEQKFSAPTSMRDVEESVHLWMRRGPTSGPGRDRGDPQMRWIRRMITASTCAESGCPCGEYAPDSPQNLRRKGLRLR